MENSAYMESVAGDRAVLAYQQDEEGALDGAQIISPPRPTRTSSGSKTFQSPPSAVAPSAAHR